MNKQSYETYMEDSVVLTYIHVVLDTILAIKLPYPVGWRELDYNLYAENYLINSNGSYIEVQWNNKQSELHTLKFERAKFKSRILNRLYFYFMPRLTTSDVARAHNVLLIIYEHFCKEVGAVQFNFADIDSYSSSMDIILALIYFRFFASRISLIEFFNVYDPSNTKLSHESVLKIGRYVDCMQRAALEF